LFESQRDGGEVAAAVETARRLLALTPLDEAMHAQLIRLYGTLGRRGLAEAHYARCAKVLREELGQEPGEAIRAALAEARRPPGGRPGPAVSEPEFGWRAAIAVLPFANLAADERWSRLADAISEDIITDLARHGDLTVIARSSSFAYRDRHADVREIGRELGVRYLLEGSIQAADRRTRVTAQLIDAQTRAHVWAERYDRDEGDLFVIQDEVVQQVAGALLGWEGRISRAERRRAHGAKPSSLLAYERYLLAYEAEAKLTRTDTERALELVESALELDPTLARAWLVRGYALAHTVLFGWAENPEAAQRSYEESILRAYALDPGDGTVLIEVGDVRAAAGDVRGACAAYEEAARVAANHGDTLALLAKYVVGTLGRPEEARTMMARAFCFNPGAPSLYFYNQLRVAYLLGDFEDAISAARQSPDTALTRSYLAMSLAQLGRVQEAEEVVRALRRDYPEFDPHSLCDQPYLLDARPRCRARRR
jgi:TolB-like protein/Flp pilus assembly protein TadD